MKLNKSSYFLPQLVGLNRFHSGFINCYLAKDSEIDHTFDYIYILSKVPNDTIASNPFLTESYGFKDNYLYKIRVSERFRDDIKLFYEGKYSQISDEAKEVIIKFSGEKPENSLVYNVLNKTSKRREFIENLIGETLDYDAEVMSVLNLEEEIIYD